ncbi:MAG: type II secretion system F family protein [Candidatus Bathyarchaeum tardum]|nr:MAG: type II secretion system F family protein [Candidatus Bathyarchaeum tardum]
MSAQKLRKWLKRAYLRINSAFRGKKSGDNSKVSKLSDGVHLGKSKPYVFAYQLIGEKVKKALPLFADLDSSLKKSGMKTNFKAYVSTVILVSLLVFTSIILVVPTVLFFVVKLSMFLSILFGVGLSLLGGALTTVIFYTYPSYRADSLKRDLEDDLAFTAGYMSILAGAGVPADSIWHSLAQVDNSLSVSNTAKNVVRDVELLGFDIISSLENTSKRTPSEKFKELIEGFISVVHSGGSLVKYLRNRSEQYMKLKQISLKRFSDNLAVLAEFYVTLMVAGSLIFVVMLSVMAMLGGGILGSLDSRLVLQLLTYIGLPIGSVVFLVIIDMVSPKR